MPSTEWNAGVGAAVALVVGYAVVITQELLLGVVAATLVYLVAWVGWFAYDRRMAAVFRPVRFGLGCLVAAAVLGFSVVFAGRVLPGAVLASLVLGVTLAVGYLDHRGYPVRLGRRRSLPVAAASVLLLGYALVVVQEIAAGLLAVGTLYLAAWLTSPVGPLRGGREPGDGTDSEADPVDD